jgi:hypothetical protein
MTKTYLKGATPAKRMAYYTERPEPEACWPWTGAVNNAGYGKFQLDGRTLGAHKVAWQLINGPVPDGLFVCHRCDNPPCCNPAHLFLGTPAENTQDMHRKNRYPVRRGAKHHKAKLTDQQVAEIRQRLQDAATPYSLLAAEFGVSKSTIWRVARRLNWKESA